jgi:FlaA1/EpsC-like NDP-sugar epimerase
MTEKKVLVTGATGFLGRHLCKALLDLDYLVVGTGNSEVRAEEFNRTFKGAIQIYTFDLGCDGHKIHQIMKDHSVDYVIHAGAVKHVGICERNPTRSIKVNLLGSANIVEASTRHDVKNAILISTDKAINPSCVYGMTKCLAERLFQESGFGVFRGVNFLFSTGSVLDIWDKQRIDGDSITVGGNDAIRYFTPITVVTERLIDSIGNPDVFTVEKCYKIGLHDLRDAFCKYHNYDKVTTYDILDVEKTEEDIPPGIKIIEPSIDGICELLEQHYRK